MQAYASSFKSQKILKFTSVKTLDFRAESWPWNRVNLSFTYR